MQYKQCQKNLDAFYAVSRQGEESLRAVYERKTAFCRDTLVLVFDNKQLVFEASEDDDTISISLKNTGSFHRGRLFKKIHSAVWQPYIGKAFGWGWVTVNQQGYCDGALLSFDGITPGVWLEVAASSIEIGKLVSEDGPLASEISIVENGAYRIGLASVRPGYLTEASSSFPVLQQHRG